MHIITSNGNKLELKEDDEDVKKYLYDNKHCAQIIVDQINNQRIYDNYLSNKKDLIILDIGANIGLFTLYAKDSASRVIAEFLGKTCLNCLNKLFGWIGKFFNLILSLFTRNLFLSFK